MRDFEIISLRYANATPENATPEMVARALTQEDDQNRKVYRITWYSRRQRIVSVRYIQVPIEYNAFRRRGSEMTVIEENPVGG